MRFRECIDEDMGTYLPFEERPVLIMMNPTNLFIFIASFKERILLSLSMGNIQKDCLLLQADI